MKGHSFFARYAWWILACFALATPLVIYSAIRTVRSNSNKVEDWLPASFAETHDLAWFRKYFVADQFVLVSWEGCQLGGNPASPDAQPDDPRIEQLAQLLVPPRNKPRSQPPVAPATDVSRYFRTVVTGRRVLDQLTAPPSNVPYELAVQRLQGSLIGPDGQQTCLIFTLSEAGLADLRSAIGRGGSRALRANDAPGALFQACAMCGIPSDEVRIGGPSVDNVAIDEEGERTLVRLAGLSTLLGLVLAWFSLRSIKLTLIVFVTGVWSALAGLGAVWLTGETSDAVLMSMPALVYVLAVSGAIHIINYYRDAVQEGGLVGAPERAIVHAWKPAVLCSVTTAIGLLSLYASDLEPIRKFGVYSAIGVFGMLGVLLLYLPAALQIWPIPADKLAAGPPHADSHIGGLAVTSRADRIWRDFASFIIRRHRLVALLCILVVVAAGWGITRNRTSIDLLKLFDSKARILADYRWLEQHLGRLIPMELVLRFPPELQRREATDQPESAADPDAIAADPPDAAVAGGDAVTADGDAESDAHPADASGRLSFLERMELVSLVQQSIEQRLGPSGQDVVGRTMSAATFAPELPSPSGATLNYVRRLATNQQLAASRPAFEQSGYFRIHPTDGTELWRISLRVAAFEDIDFGHFVQDLRQAVEPVLAAHRYRSEVLRQVASHRDSHRVAGATVLLWQPPNQQASAVEVSTGAAAGVTHEIPSTQTVLTASLNAFLRRDRLRIVTTNQDPAALLASKPDSLKPFDAVVLVGQFPPADVKQIRCAAETVIIAVPPDLTADVTTDVATIVTANTKADSAPASSARDPGELTATYTGVVPIVYKTQRVLLTSLIESAFWSFITITPLMMFVCRGVAAGAVAMLPNVLPVLVVFGGMGWLDLPIDIGSMMAASIALGVAVDDTIHYLTWFRDDLNVGHDRQRSILYAYRRCATPTLQAALVNGLGLSIFMFSTFTPTRQFGFLMLTILVTGVIAELIMLPALLASPMGRAFRPNDAESGWLRRGWARLTRHRLE